MPVLARAVEKGAQWAAQEVEALVRLDQGWMWLKKLRTTCAVTPRGIRECGAINQALKAEHIRRSMGQTLDQRSELQRDRSNCFPPHSPSLLRIFFFPFNTILIVFKWTAKPVGSTWHYQCVCERKNDWLLAGFDKSLSKFWVIYSWRKQTRTDTNAERGRAGTDIQVHSITNSSAQVNLKGFSNSTWL